MGVDTNTGKFSDVPVRVRSWVYIIIVFAAMLVHPSLMSVIVALLSLYSLKEYSTMTSVKSNVLRVLLYIIVVPVFISLYINNYLFFLISVVSSVIIISIANMLFIREKKQTINIIAGVFICVFSIGHLSFIRELNNPQELINGVKMVIFLVLLTELNDVFQYLTGKTFGKHKIVPRISPNKTVEGFLGGVILTTLLANIIGPFLLPQKGIVIYSVMGILISVLGFSGDVCMSFIKRKSGVKDTGNLIPGHGGLLDRMDSLLFVLPLFYWSVVLMYFK